MIYITESDIKQMVLEVLSKLDIYTDNKTVLNEGFSKKLYHFTTIANLESLLKTGKMKLYCSSSGNSYDFIMNMAKPVKGRPGEYYSHYICLTRQRNGETGYPSQMNGRNPYKNKRVKQKGGTDKYCVRIEVDSDVLSKYFKYLSVNYFHPNNTNTWADKETTYVPFEKRFELNQTEERGLINQEVFSIEEHPELIKRIDIYFPNKYRAKQEKTIKTLNWIINESPLKDKIFYYNNINDFNGLKKVDGESELQPRDAHKFELFTTQPNETTVINKSVQDKIAGYVLMLSYSYKIDIDIIIDRILPENTGFKQETEKLKPLIYKAIKKVTENFKETPWDIFKSTPSLGMCIRQYEGFLKSIFLTINTMFQEICKKYNAPKYTPIGLYKALVNLNMMPIKPRTTRKKNTTSKTNKTKDSNVPKKRGRPKKTQTVISSTPKKRGRPKKAQTDISSEPKRRGRPRKNYV